MSGGGCSRGHRPQNRFHRRASNLLLATSIPHRGVPVRRGVYSAHRAPDKMVSDTFLSLQRQKHPARAVRKAPETEMLVKALGALIAGVDDQRP